MKIGIFTNNYLPNPYGVSTSIETFRRDFERRGHTVYIFAPSYPGYIDKNKNVFRYPSFDIEFKIKFPLAIPYSWKMRKIIKNLDLDIIHAQHPALLGTAAMRWARKLTRRKGGKKVPLIFTWHTLYDQYAHFASIIPSSIAARYMIRKAVKYANRADVVIVPTDSITKKLRDWGVKKKIIPVPTGVVEEEFQLADREIIRNKYGIRKEETLLLLVSRLTTEKNILFVVRAVKNILRGNKQVKLLVAGGGYLLAEIVKIAEKEGVIDSIFLAGEVAHNQLKNYYAAGDIFVYGSKSETQGMIISEAMYMGLPIVAVDATGTNSLVLNRANGFLVKEDEKEFSAAVMKLIDDKNLREKFGETSRRIAKQNFISSICADKLVSLYEQLIEAK